MTPNDDTTDGLLAALDRWWAADPDESLAEIIETAASEAGQDNIRQVSNGEVLTYLESRLQPERVARQRWVWNNARTPPDEEIETLADHVGECGRGEAGAFRLLATSVCTNGEAPNYCPNCGKALTV